MLDVVTILIERGHNVILLTSGKYEPSSEYPVNQACIDVANNLNKPVVGFTSFMQLMEPKPYKSDPMYGSYAYGPSIRKLNDIKGQMNINPVSEKEPKFSLSLVDTFFGFELPQSSAPNVQEIGPVLSEEYPPLTPELSDFINGHRRVLYVAFVQH
ncbi:unnamed protein product [Rhizophagus irregularis]|nr:unnamed protein product [Rhizophagus irregularis]